MKDEEARDIRKYLNVIKRAMSYIENIVGDTDLDNFDDPRLHEDVVPRSRVEDRPTFLRKPKEEKFEVIIPNVREDHLREIMAIEDWPCAVPEFLTHEPTDEDQRKRSNAILDMMLPGQISGMHFLDFGCGDGWVADEIIKRDVASSTAYDVKISEVWERLPNTTFAADVDDLQSSQYDIIFLYDVLDHAEDPVNLMQQVHRLLAKDGRVYVRCHPWTSKHANHIYKLGLNKSYIHLFLRHEEMAVWAGNPPMFTRPEIDPVTAYHWWFDKFSIKKEVFKEETVPEFFLTREMKEMIAVEQGLDKIKAKKFIDMLNIQFVDYVLAKK